MNKAVLVLIITAACSLPTFADSLYPGSSTYVGTVSGAVSLFSDSKARAVGDSLSIVIQESASAASSANTKTSKTENFGFGPGIGPILHNIGTFGLSSSTGSNAAGTTDRTDTLNAHVQVIVTKVLPNGNLVVEGKHSVTMNAETQQITLTGIVRPVDITPANTVLSSLVTDAQIKYSGKGPVGEKQHDGIITSLFRFLF